MDAIEIALWNHQFLPSLYMWGTPRSRSCCSTLNLSWPVPALPNIEQWKWCHRTSESFVRSFIASAWDAHSGWSQPPCKKSSYPKTTIIYGSPSWPCEEATWKEMCPTGSSGSRHPSLMPDILIKEISVTAPALLHPYKPWSKNTLT